MKKIYTYDNNLIFIGEDFAFKNPLEKGYIYPKNCTELKPEIQAGYLAMFIDGAWVYLPDNRGIVLYSTIDGSTIEFSGIGDLPEKSTIDPRPNAYYVWSDGWVMTEESIKQAAIDSTPKSITKRQALLALHRLGKLTEIVDAVKAGDFGVEMQIEYETATVIERDNPQAKLIFEKIGFSDDEILQFFNFASKI